MTRRRRPPLPFTPATAWLVLALVAAAAVRGQEKETHSEAPAAPVPKSAGKANPPAMVQPSTTERATAHAAEPPHDATTLKQDLHSDAPPAIIPKTAAKTDLTSAGQPLATEKATEHATEPPHAAPVKPQIPGPKSAPQVSPKPTAAAPTEKESHAVTDKAKSVPKAKPAPATATPAPHAASENPEHAVAVKPPHPSAEKPAHPAPDKLAHAPAETASHTAKDKATPATPEISPHTTADLRGLLKLGVALTERGDYESAEIAFRQVLKTPRAPEPEIKAALLGLARMHRKQGALTKAVAIFERFLKDYPGDDLTPDALLELGRSLRSLGVYKLAIARFYSVINSTLKLPGEGFDRYQLLAKTAQFEIAETHFQAGDFAEAGKYYTRLRLLDLAPVDRARAHFKAAYALRLQGSREEAATTLRAYLEQWPEDENVPEARYLLAITLRELNRPQEAFAATLELLRSEKMQVGSDPKRWAYWQRKTGNQLANDFFETGDTINARAIYAGLLELSPDLSWRLPITYQVALCDERLGTSDRARLSYQVILQAVGEKPAPEFLELATMAKWRLEHLDWRDRIGRQISDFFESTDRKQASATAESPVPNKTASIP